VLSVIMLLRLVDDALVRQQHDVWLAIVTDFLSIAGIPAVMGRDEKTFLSNTDRMPEFS